MSTVSTILLSTLTLILPFIEAVFPWNDYCPWCPEDIEYCRGFPRSLFLLKFNKKIS